MPSFTHAQIDNASTSGLSSFAIYSSYSYTCDDGYRFLDGNVTGVIECDVTGDWIGIAQDGDST